MKAMCRIAIILLLLALSGAADEGFSTSSVENVSADLAETREKLESEVARLNSVLAAVRIKLREEGAVPAAEYIGTLERKALAFEAGRSEVAVREEEIKRLNDSLEAAKREQAERDTHIGELMSTTNRLTSRILQLESEQKPLKEALDLIRKGKYEYYEIKPGDTCESIAKQPTIYGDATKHVLIRQANRGGVADLDKLEPGEVLVIPRFQIGGNYEF